MPDVFARPDVKEAARRIAVRWQALPPERLQSLPLHRAHECRTQVDHPAYAGDFAFVSYVSQSGKLGAMAFQRREGKWHEVQRVALGYW